MDERMNVQSSHTDDNKVNGKLLASHKNTGSTAACCDDDAPVKPRMSRELLLWCNCCVRWLQSLLMPRCLSVILTSQPYVGTSAVLSREMFDYVITCFRQTEPVVMGLCTNRTTPSHIRLSTMWLYQGYLYWTGLVDKICWNKWWTSQRTQWKQRTAPHLQITS